MSPFCRANRAKCEAKFCSLPFGLAWSARARTRAWETRADSRCDLGKGVSGLRSSRIRFRDQGEKGTPKNRGSVPIGRAHPPSPQRVSLLVVVLAARQALATLLPIIAACACYNVNMGGSIYAGICGIG